MHASVKAKLPLFWPPLAGTPAGWGGAWAASLASLFCSSCPCPGCLWHSRAGGRGWGSLSQEGLPTIEPSGLGRFQILTFSLRNTSDRLLGDLPHHSATVPLKKGGASSLGLFTAPWLLHPSSHFQPHSAGVPSHLSGSPLPQGAFQEGLILLLTVGSTGALRETHSWKYSPLTRSAPPPTHQIPDLTAPPPRLPKAFSQSLSPLVRGDGGELLPLPGKVWLGDRQSECADNSLGRVFSPAVPGGC